MNIYTAVITSNYIMLIEYKGLVQVDVWDRELQRMLDKTYLDEARRVKIGFIQHELQFSISLKQPVPFVLSRKNTHFVTKSTRKCYVAELSSLRRGRETS